MADRPIVTCPRCGRSSPHPIDAQQGYCASCHDWTGEPAARSEPEVGAAAWWAVFAESYGRRPFDPTTGGWR